MKDDKRISFKEYRENNDVPWDNEWLATVANGETINLYDSVFYNIGVN